MMKKGLALVLAMIMMLSLFGCGDKEDKLGTTIVGGVSEEHQEMIFEAVDPDVMVVENALHLYMPELYGHTDVEFLLACVDGINPFAWTENETRVELPEEELETINQILNL